MTFSLPYFNIGLSAIFKGHKRIFAALGTTVQKQFWTPAVLQVSQKF